MLMTEEKFLTVKEIAEQYRLSEETIRRYIRQKKLEAVEFENSYRILPSAWQRFLDRPKDKK